MQRYEKIDRAFDAIRHGNDWCVDPRCNARHLRLQAATLFDCDVYPALARCDPRAFPARIVVF